jgi:hypothetical protein
VRASTTTHLHRQTCCWIQRSRACSASTYLFVLPLTNPEAAYSPALLALAPSALRATAEQRHRIRCLLNAAIKPADQPVSFQGDLSPVSLLFFPLQKRVLLNFIETSYARSLNESFHPGTCKFTASRVSKML